MEAWRTPKVGGMTGCVGSSKPPRTTSWRSVSDPKTILLMSGTIQPMKKKRRSSWDLDKDKVAAAEAILRESRTLSRDPERLLRTVAEGKPVRLPRRLLGRRRTAAQASGRRRLARHA